MNENKENSPETAGSASADEGTHIAPTEEKANKVTQPDLFEENVPAQTSKDQESQPPEVQAASEQPEIGPTETQPAKAIQNSRKESPGSPETAHQSDRDNRDSEVVESPDSEKKEEKTQTSGPAGESTGKASPSRQNSRRSSSKKAARKNGRNRKEGGAKSEEPAADQGGQGGDQGDQVRDKGEKTTPKKSKKELYKERKEKQRAKEAAILAAAPPIETEGIVEISPKGFGFLREAARNFNQSPKDVFITPEIVRQHSLRDGLKVKCISKEGVRGPQLVELLEINGKSPEDYLNLPYFEELTAVNPTKRLTLETDSSRLTTRVIDLVTPIGLGQRGLIVAPPRTGKTTMLQHIAEAVQSNYPDMHLMVLLIDERPEEVTDFERSFPDAEVLSSSNDDETKDHTRIAMLAIERAKRLVEAGENVFILMDSITRLARAFNNSMRGGKGKGIASGGLTIGALEMPRRLFAAARNTREAGSLTIVATALIQTNSKADEAIFQEFKGTGNMELVLDRQLAQNYIYPAVDINKSGTRREELLLPAHMLEKIYVIRRGLSTYKSMDAMEWLLRCMERYPSNAQMLMDIKTTALS